VTAFWHFSKNKMAAVCHVGFVFFTI